MSIASDEAKVRLGLSEYDPEIDSVRQQHEALSRLAAEIKQLRNAARAAMNELGVPQPGYLQPVTNAYEILEKALAGTTP